MSLSFNSLRFCIRFSRYICGKWIVIYYHSQWDSQIFDLLRHVLRTMFHRNPKHLQASLTCFAFRWNALLIASWRWWDSNSWPPACKAGALPTELHPRMPPGFSLILFFYQALTLLIMGLNGLEPSTSRLSGVRSNQLSYKPIYSWRKIPQNWTESILIK